jgi:glycosyltransferase involved in cell wall biosynthesis
MAEVAIGIPTFRRPQGLEALLDSLGALNTSHRLTVIIADNDAALHQGIDSAKNVGVRGYRWPLRLLVVDKRGISHVRNALIDAFLEDCNLHYLAMLDDDEVADPRWLDELLRVLGTCGADVAGSRLDRRLESGAPAWAHTISYLNSKSRGCSGPVDLVDSTGSIVFTRAILTRAVHPVFDPAFGLTGGEDKEALTRLQRQGARFAWADAAVVTEIIPAARVTENWVLQRSYRIGNSDIRVMLRHRSSIASVSGEVCKALLVFTLAPLAWPWALRHPTLRIQVKVKLWRAMGKLSGLFGFAYPEYAKRQAGS